MKMQTGVLRRTKRIKETKGTCVQRRLKLFYYAKELARIERCGHCETRSRPSLQQVGPMASNAFTHNGPPSHRRLLSKSRALISWTERECFVFPMFAGLVLFVGKGLVDPG